MPPGPCRVSFGRLRPPDGPRVAGRRTAGAARDAHAFASKPPPRASDAGTACTLASHFRRPSQARCVCATHTTSSPPAGAARLSLSLSLSLRAPREFSHDLSRGELTTPGIEPGLSRPQRDVLTTRRCGRLRGFQTCIPTLQKPSLAPLPAAVGAFKVHACTNDQGISSYANGLIAQLVRAYGQ